MNGIRNTVLATMAGASLFCTAAQAQTAQIWGGGDAVTAPAVKGEFTLLADPSVTLNYASIPGNAAVAAFLNQDQAALGGTAGGPVHFAIGYNLLTQAQIDTWNATMAPKAGNLVELPAFSVAIAIPYSYSYYKQLTVNDADLCGIFSGKVTDWSKLTGTVSPSQKKHPLSGPINVVVHAEPTHETLFLTRHLAAVCTPSNAAITFTATDVFSTLFPNGLPSNFTQVSSSAAMQAAMTGPSAVANAIGYVDAAFTSYYPNAPETSSTIQVAKVFNTARGSATPPSTTMLITARKYPGDGATNTPPTTTATEAVQNNWIPVPANPTIGYPIFGYMTVVLPQCFSNPAVEQAVVTELFNTFHATGAQTMATTGFVGSPSLFNVPVNRIFLDAVVHSPASVDSTSLRIGVAGVTNSKATGYSFPCATKTGL